MRDERDEEIRALRTALHSEHMSRFGAGHALIECICNEHTAAVERFDESAEVFEHFWASYPKRAGAKVGKAAAKKQWLKLKPSERIGAVDGLIAYSVAKGAYPEDAERYLRHKRWVGLEVDTTEDRNERILRKAHEMATEMGVN